VSAFVAVTESERRVIFEHYELVAPLIAANFPNAPLVVSYYPRGLSEKPTYSAGDWDGRLPEAVPAVSFETSSGRHVYPGCTESSILWLVHEYAVGMQSWTPSRHDPKSVGFARLNFRCVGEADEAMLKEALLAVRGELLSQANGTEAVPLLDGVHAATLFIPFSDAPTYEAVRAWLHPFVERAIAEHPELLVGEKHPHEVFTSARIQCTFVSNAVCLHSSLPYALNGTPDLPMVTPIDWNELGTIRNGEVTARNARARLAHGDVFAREVERIGAQTFADAVR
jgi:DNA primase